VHRSRYAPIILKIEKAIRICNLKKGRENQTHAVDREVELKYWQHPADEAKILEAHENKDQTIHAYTDGSKTRNGVGSGVALYIGTELALQENFKLDTRCSNNQAQQLTITKALEAIEKIDIPQDTLRTAIIFTDSRLSIDSIRNTKNHSHLIEETRKKLTSLERANSNIELSWVKAHVGIVGNELGDRLARAVASDNDAKIVFNRLPLSTLISNIEEETKLKWQKNGKRVQRPE
jgi:ribonuclease HI